MAIPEPIEWSPCPFCGQTAGLHQLEARTGEHRETLVSYIQCKDCGASGPLAFSKTAAAVKWNTRGS